jgi:tRNA (guanine37-N1)-methyltransferase
VRVDVVTIFPAWFDVLDLSLTGKARESGLLDVTVHDLRDWTHDRHRTVDDAPYGGGAGMVMKPEPWGEALDALRGDATPTLLVPTPSGVPFSQALVRELAGHDHLVVACGRYEGIDQRVVIDAATRMPVRELSIGDYVLAGGEVAAMVMIEAITRLIPGVLGNPASAGEDSFSGALTGLLEAPSYTRPPVYRGIGVPEVLTSGDHGAVARYRHEESLRRTAANRPDLLDARQLG